MANRRGRIALLVLLGSLLGSVPARAEDSSANPFVDVDMEMEATYRETIRDGVAEYQAGHFQEALSLFRRAHQLSPSARTWRGIGMTAFELRDYVLAMHSLSAALHDTRKPLSPEQRKDAQALIERTRMFVDVYRIELVPDTAHLLMDGQEPELEPDGTLLLSLGTHSLEVAAPGMATLSKSITAKGGHREDLRLALEAMPEPGEPVAKQPPAPPIGDVSAPMKEPTNWKAVAWLLGSAGSALAATGAGLYWSRQASALSTCSTPKDGKLCTTKGTLTMERNLAMTATIVAGTAAATMAVIGVLTWNSKPAPTNQQALQCSLSPFAITCGSTF